MVVNTAAGAAYGRPDYVARGCGMGRAATLYLLERGVRVTGTDGWSWDAPFVHTKERYAQTGDAGLIWEGHRAGMEIGYCHLEKLHNLEALPATGFLVSLLPVQHQRRLGRLHPRGRDPRGLIMARPHGSSAIALSFDRHRVMAAGADAWCATLDGRSRLARSPSGDQADRDRRGPLR